jgi:hypothetical protein
VLVSADGRTWQAVDGQGAFGGSGLVAGQAAAGAAGYVIVGYQQAPGGRGRTTAAAWYSASPAARKGWHRAALDGPGASQMLAVTAAPAGFVAVGAHNNQASVWAARDGRTWSQEDLPLPAGYARAVLQHVADSGRTVVAAGTALTTTGRQVPFAAASSDGGATWSQFALPAPEGQATVTALAATGRGFTATGVYGRVQGQQDVVVWTSPSGRDWKAATPSGQGLTGPGIQAITALTATGSTLAGVGFTATPSGEQPVFWQAPIRSPLRASRTRPPGGWPGTAGFPARSGPARCRPRPPPPKARGRDRP